MTELVWFLIGAQAMGVFMLGMLFFHRPTQRKWLAQLRRILERENA
jgi:hypothetical protein